MHIGAYLKNLYNIIYYLLIIYNINVDIKLICSKDNVYTKIIKYLVINKID